ncbi:MAG: hypothetical protein GY909_15765 [Oligoflexia bacterium]|nr:hypothetical protein [Oligoflexia bacterium]
MDNIEESKELDLFDNIPVDNSPIIEDESEETAFIIDDDYLSMITEIALSLPFKARGGSVAQKKNPVYINSGVDENDCINVTNTEVTSNCGPLKKRHMQVLVALTTLAKKQIEDFSKVGIKLDHKMFMNLPGFPITYTDYEICKNLRISTNCATDVSRAISELAKLEANVKEFSYDPITKKRSNKKAEDVKYFSERTKISQSVKENDSEYEYIEKKKAFKKDGESSFTKVIHLNWKYAKKIENQLNVSFTTDSLLDIATASGQRGWMFLVARREVMNKSNVITFKGEEILAINSLQDAKKPLEAIKKILNSIYDANPCFEYSIIRRPNEGLKYNVVVNFYDVDFNYIASDKNQFYLHTFYVYGKELLESLSMSKGDLDNKISMLTNDYKKITEKEDSTITYQGKKIEIAEHIIDVFLSQMKVSRPLKLNANSYLKAMLQRFLNNDLIYPDGYETLIEKVNKKKRFRKKEMKIKGKELAQAKKIESEVKLKKEKLAIEKFSMLVDDLWSDLKKRQKLSEHYTPIVTSKKSWILEKDMHGYQEALDEEIKQHMLEDFKSGAFLNGKHILDRLANTSKQDNSRKLSYEELQSRGLMQ